VSDQASTGQGTDAGLRTGDMREVVVVKDLMRTQIVQYAGASGDFNPLHTDEVYARQAAGYPTVFAHGMLTMALTGRVVTDWFGPRQVRRLSARFKGQVWPGDTLSTTATIAALDGAEVRLDLETRNQHGVTVLTGEAVVLRSV